VASTRCNGNEDFRRRGNGYGGFWDACVASGPISGSKFQDQVVRDSSRQTWQTGPPGRNLRRIRRQRCVVVRWLPFSSRGDYVGRHVVADPCVSVSAVHCPSPDLHHTRTSRSRSRSCLDWPAVMMVVETRCRTNASATRSTAREVGRENAVQVTAEAFILHNYTPPSFFYLILFFLF